MPWEEALARDPASPTASTTSRRTGIYRIDTAEDLREEKLAVERSRKQVEDLAALELGIATLAYANAEEVKDSLEKMLTDRGNIDVDVRTNSLLINDVAERVAMITNMAQRLDSETPQVEINARLVDMDTRATRELGINWSVGQLHEPRQQRRRRPGAQQPGAEPGGRPARWPRCRTGAS